jgi:hypothetical protein
VRETLLCAFFEGREDGTGLADGLQDVLGRGALRKGENLVLDLDRTVAVSPRDLIRLCDATLAGDLDADDLQAAARFVVASEHFFTESGTPEGELAARVLADWSAPASHYPLTGGNLQRYREGLREGSYPFAR